MKDFVLFDANHPIRVTPQKNVLFSDTQQGFETLLEGSRRVLLKISSIFPFDFFPDEITIDEYKVSVVVHEFFLSGDVHCITIDMIRDIEVETGPFFATLKIVPDVYPSMPVTVKYLRKKDAIKARRIIQGLMIAWRRGIDPCKLDKLDFLEEIESIGNTNMAE